MKSKVALKILVVEDEVIIADNLCLTLKTLGYNPLEPALSYQEAIICFEQENIDLVILDVNLKSSKTGIDLARIINQKLNIPFIFLTAYSDNNTLDLAKEVNPYGYLVKPYESADVFTAIEIAMNNARNFRKVSAAVVEQDGAGNLTSSEKIVLGLIAENLSTKEIAEKLFVSQSTVKNHRHNICSKLDLKGGTHSLLKWVMENQDWINQNV